MGQGKSSNIKDRQLYEPAHFDEYPRVSDPRYGDIRPLAHKISFVQFVALSRTIQTEEEFSRHVGELEIRSQLSHPQLVRLVNYNSKKVDELCSAFYTVGILYEYWPNNLQNELVERSKVNAPYREGEIWYMLDALLSVVSYLQKENICHGDIRPYNLQLTSTGEIKVGEIFKNKQQLSGFSQIVNQQLSDYYISPQLFQALQNFRGVPDYDKYKSEVYSVGMTILEAATLQSVSDACYDQERFVIRQDQVNRLLSLVRSQYSNELYTFLSKILNENEAERPTPTELLVQLNQPYVLSQKTLNLSLIQLIADSRNDVREEEEEKVVRSAPPAVQPEVQQQAVVYETYVPQPLPPVVANDNQYDDLNARIQAVLAMSRDTIARYGAVQPIDTKTYTSTTTTTTVPTTTYPTYVYEPQASARASQVQTRTYLNENTNNIETRNYSLPFQATSSSYTATQYQVPYTPAPLPPVSQEPIEETIKRAARNYETKETTEAPQQQQVPLYSFNNNTATDAIQQSYTQELYRQPQTFTTSSYTPVTVGNTQVTSTYVPSNIQYTNLGATFGASDLQGLTPPLNNNNNNNNNQITYVTSSNYQQNGNPAVVYTSTSQSQAPVAAAAVAQTENQVNGGQQVTNYTTSTQLNFQTAEERNAYVNQILAEMKNQQGGQNANTQVTYTSYVDTKPIENVTSYTTNTFSNGVTY